MNSAPNQPNSKILLRFFSVVLLSLIFAAFIGFTESAESSATCPTLMEWLAMTGSHGFIPETAPVVGIYVAAHRAFRDLPAQIIREQIVPLYVSRDIWPHDKIIYSGEVNRLHLPEANNIWVRDYLPELVRGSNGKFHLVRFRYTKKNDRDNLHREVAHEWAKAMRLPLVESSLMVQGGNLMVDENGVLFVTHHIEEENLLSRDEIVRELKDKLHVKEVHWIPTLPKEFEGTGHIDLFAKYLGKNRILVSSSVDAELGPGLDRIARRFSRLGYQVFRIENEPLHNQVHEGVIRSYTNSQIVNDWVIMPVYRESDTDRSARAIYESLGFKVAEVNTAEIFCMGGAVHCATRQLHLAPVASQTVTLSR